MHSFMLLKGEAKRSFGVLALLVLVLGCALALCLITTLSSRMAERSATQAADSFDLIAGARTSQYSLLFGTVYLKNEPLNLLPGSAYDLVRESKGLRWAAPLAFGDRIGPYTIVGTTRDFVTQGGARPLAEGRNFEKSGEAVVGASVKYAVGEEVIPVHGRSEGMGHEHEHHSYRIVGRLPPGGTPWDEAVLVPVKSVWDMHGAHEAHPEEEPVEAWMNSPLRRDKAFSAIVLKPESVSDAYRLRQKLNSAQVSGSDGKSEALMGIFTGEVLVSLYAMTDRAGAALSAVGAAAAAIALVVTLAACALLSQMRRPLFLQLRYLGASRGYVTEFVWLFQIGVVTLGVLAGYAFAEIGTAALGAVIGRETGIAMSPVWELSDLIPGAAVWCCGALIAFAVAFFVSRDSLR